MPPKKNNLSKAQIEAMMNRDSDSEDENYEEIFGPGVELEDTEQDLAQPLPSASGAADVNDDDNVANEIESKHQNLLIGQGFYCFCDKQWKKKLAQKNGYFASPFCVDKAFFMLVKRSKALKF